MWDEYEPDCICSDCEKKDDCLDNSKEFLKEIVDILYSNNKLDLEHLEFCLDNLCHYLNVKLPANELALQKATITDNAIDAWKEWNNNYLKSLTYIN